MNETVISEAFEQAYNTLPTIAVRAPGRINLIGEHTDYNDGFVLPASIDKAIYFCLSKREDRQVVLHSVDLEDNLEISLDALMKSDKDWANFLIGVTKEIIDSGGDLDVGFNLAFGGDVPLGAGLSSSAAIESGLGFALNQLYDLHLSLLDLALVAQRAEHNFAGVRCGIMDMYASLMGKENEVIKLDCKNLSHSYLPFNFDEISVILFNTGVKHNLADSAYNKRREECETGLKILKDIYPEVTSFRDVNLSMLDAHKSKFDTKVFSRCHYVLSEEKRMKQATVALENGALETFGQLMFETHKGLKEDYEVSCDELDFLVDLASENKAILGSRMMGGGFGGCTINLIKKEAVHGLIDNFKTKYLERFNIGLDHFEVKIMDGCSVIYELEKQRP